MHAYKDEPLTSEIADTNSVYIGDRVWVKIHTTKNLPSNIDYWLTDCTAYRDFQDKQGDQYSMIEVCFLQLHPFCINTPFSSF